MRLREYWEILCRKETWLLIGLCLGLGALAAVGASYAIDFDAGHRICRAKDNWSAFFFMLLIFSFLFGGLTAIGQAFVSFDNRKKGRDPQTISLIVFVVIAGALGAAGVGLLAEFCS